MKKVLVVVDMQKDFINGSLGTNEAQKIVSNVVKKIESTLADNGSVLFTMDTHYDNYLETQEGKHLPIKHCIKNTEGFELWDEIKQFASTSEIFEKGTFGSKELAETLAKDLPDEIELVGLCTDICVITNAFVLKTFLPECKIIVDSSCCAGVTPQSHRNALEAMKTCQIEVIGDYQ